MATNTFFKWIGWSRNRSRMASNFWRKISGTPGRTYTLRTSTVGKRIVSPPTSSAPSGISAILRCDSLSRSRKCRSSRPTSMGWRTTLAPIAIATPSIVTSSWVGPTPPDVKTTSWARLKAVTSWAISGISSGMTEMRRTSTPSARSSRHRYAALASAIFPERISLPTRMMPAVFGIGPARFYDARMRESTRRRRVAVRAADRRGAGAPAGQGALINGGAMIELSGWALTLGASSGFGEAVSLALARAGLNIFGVHLDRKATMVNVERITAEIKALGREALFFNVNAADAEKRAEIAGQMEKILEERGEPGALRVLLHSLAFGTLKLYIADPMKEVVTSAQMDMTLDVMAHSLVYWTQEVVGRGLMTRGGRIYAMTSSGGTRVLPFYGPVSAAKAALESHIRQLASELAPQGITANAIRAGVTDTPALQKIPRHDTIIAEARRRNPSGRMTTPDDVARAIVVLSHPDTYWITGNVIGVDGGEDIVG